MAHEALTSEGTFWQVCSLQNPNMLATSPPIYSIYNSSQSIQWDLHRLWYFFKLLTFKVFIRGPIVFSVLNVTIKMWSFDGVSTFHKKPLKILSCNTCLRKCSTPLAFQGLIARQPCIPIGLCSPSYIYSKVCGCYSVCFSCSSTPTN